MILLQTDSLSFFNVGKNDMMWLIGIFITILIPIITILLNNKWQRKLIELLNSIKWLSKKNVRSSRGKNVDAKEREHAKLTDNKGLFEIDFYWGERKMAYEAMHNGLKEIKNDIFISGIALRTISEMLQRDDVIDHLKNRIEAAHSSFKINIIACDTVESAKRPEQLELEKNINNGKVLLSQFKDKLYGKISRERINKETKKPFLTINSYPSNISPRHFIAKLDEFIYVGSYLNCEEGHKSYIMRLKKIESTNIIVNKYIGLYELFKTEINYLEEKCKNQFVFNKKK